MTTDTGRNAWDAERRAALLATTRLFGGLPADVLAACAPACPVNAIYFEDDLPADLKQYIAINADYYKQPR